jgi:hypothetical protein
MAACCGCLGHEDDLPGAGSGSRLAGNDGQQMLVGSVEDPLRGVEAKAVDVELAHPVRAVAAEELAHGPGLVAIDVERVSPLALVAL